MRVVQLNPTQKRIITILNQLFQLEQKIGRSIDRDSMIRNIVRIKEEFAQVGYMMENPSGEQYDETRTDCEASIAGNSTENLVISEVLKPLIRLKQDNQTYILQRAVVIVQSCLTPPITEGT